MKVTSGFARVLFSGVLLVAAPGAWAVKDIPTESGFSGSVGLSAGYTDAETNLVKGNALWEIGSDNIATVNQEASSEDDFFLSPGLELAYTFGGPQIQLFLESDIEDAVTLEFLSLVGVRKQFDSLGILSLAVITQSTIPQEVWEDPYDATQSRSDTDQESTGVRFVWDRIAGLPIEAMVQYRDIEIDDESSGAALVTAGTITAQQAQLLDREGDDYRAEVRYNWRKSKEEIFSPFIGYVEADLDGDAVSNDGWYLGLDAGYQNETWGLAGRVKVGSRDFDDPNPVYGRDTDEDTVEIAVRGNVKLPFGNNWYGTGAISYAESNVNVDFHEQKNLFITTGAEYRFGRR